MKNPIDTAQLFNSTELEGANQMTDVLISYTLQFALGKQA